MAFASHIDEIDITLVGLQKFSGEVIVELGHCSVDVDVDEVRLVEGDVKR